MNQTHNSVEKQQAEDSKSSPESTPDFQSQRTDFAREINSIFTPDKQVLFQQYQERIAALKKAQQPQTFRCGGHLVELAFAKGQDDSTYFQCIIDQKELDFTQWLKDL